MKALLLNGPYDFGYEERPYPECPSDHVVVRTDAVCICGSDMGAVRGKNPLFVFPRIIGHEVSGTVHEVGDEVTGLSVGDKVCLMPCISCGHCRACQKGKSNTCRTLELFGVQQDGGLQEYLSAPAKNWLKISADAPPEEICMLEPLAIGAHAVARLELQPSDRVLVIGAGPIGVSCAVNARACGAQVTMSDFSKDRRSFVSGNFGLEVLDPSSEDYMERINSITDNELFDAVIDTTASKASMENTWRWITYGGKILFVGICNGTLELEGLPFHKKEPSLYVTRNSTREDFERVLNLWERGLLDPGQFITHEVSFSEAAGVLGSWTDPASGVFKGVVRF